MWTETAKHELMVDRLYPGPGMRFVCACGEWEARGARPFSLEEAEVHERHQEHAESEP